MHAHNSLPQNNVLVETHQADLTQENKTIASQMNEIEEKVIDNDVKIKDEWGMFEFYLFGSALRGYRFIREITKTNDGFVCLAVKEKDYNKYPNWKTDLRNRNIKFFVIKSYDFVVHSDNDSKDSDNDSKDSDKEPQIQRIRKELELNSVILGELCDSPNQNIARPISILNHTESLVGFALVSEYCNQGDLKFLIRSKKFHITDSSEMITYANQLVSGLAWLHERDIVHSDLALRNIFAHSSDNNKIILKIGDFGLSQHVEKYDFTETTSLLGDEVPPEILNYVTKNARTKETDVYMLGVILTQMMAKEEHKKFDLGLMTETDRIPFKIYIEDVTLEGYYLHLMSDELPNDLKKYSNSYIFDSKAEQLYYINQDGIKEKTDIIDKNKFNVDLAELNKAKKDKILLSTGQIASLITSNGGHTPIENLASPWESDRIGLRYQVLDADKRLHDHIVSWTEIKYNYLGYAIRDAATIVEVPLPETSPLLAPRDPFRRKRACLKDLLRYTQKPNVRHTGIHQQLDCLSQRNDTYYWLTNEIVSQMVRPLNVAIPYSRPTIANIAKRLSAWEQYKKGTSMNQPGLKTLSRSRNLFWSYPNSNEDSISSSAIEMKDEDFNLHSHISFTPFFTHKRF